MKKFLLIDDDAVFAGVMQRAFGRRDMMLEWAENGAAALEYTDMPDGIILDLNLGAESGLDLLPVLKKRFPKSRILVLTGYASISTAVSAVKSGAFQYLPKPADVPTILQAFQMTEDKDPVQVSSSSDNAEGPSLQRLQWEHIQFVLQQHDGNISATARALNMHRRTLQRMLAKHPVKK